jgi:hypothetical protein
MMRSQLAQHLHNELGQLATILEYKTESSYDAIIDRVLLQEDTDDLSSIDRRLLLALAERELWRRVANHTSGFHNITSADGERRERAKIHEHALARYNEASSIVDSLTGAASVRIGRIKSDVDPYMPVRKRSRFGWWQV